MPYTKQPEQQTHQQKRIPAVGGVVPFNNLAQNTGIQYINCAPVKYDLAGANPHWQVEPRPRFNKGNVVRVLEELRGSYHYAGETEEQLYVFTNKLYRNGTELYTLHYNAGPVHFCRIPGGVFVLETHVSQAWGHTIFFDGTTNASAELPFGAQGVPVFTDGYIFVAEDLLAGHTATIYNSTLGAMLTFDDANDYIDAEQFADSIVTLSTHRNHVVAFGTNSTEFFKDTANEIGSPLTRQTNYAKGIGLFVPRSTTYSYNLPTVCNVHDDLYFISRQEGMFGVWQIKDFGFSKISNNTVDKFINQHDADNFADIQPYITTIFAYNELCILLQWYDGTEIYKWIYQPSLKMWSQWSTADVDQAFLLLNGEAYINNATRIYLSTNAAFSSFYELSVSDTGENVTSTIITDYLDFDSYYMKHWHTVDILGKLNGNFQTLYKSFDLDQGDYTLVNTGFNGLPRYHNLGRSRHLSLKLELAGSVPFAFDGFDVKYEQGRY